MPRSTNTYYHTVVYFCDEYSNNHTPSSKRFELGKLRNSLIEYLGKVRSTERKNFIVADHFFSDDRSVIQYLNWESIHSNEFQHIRHLPGINEASSARIEPHLHIVHYCASRKPAGAWRIIDKWLDRTPGSLQSSSQVKCYNALRKYLHQGCGRCVRHEELSNSVESGDSDCRAHDQTSAFRTTNFQCEDDGGDRCNQLDGYYNEDPGRNAREGSPGSGDEDGAGFGPVGGPGERIVQAILESGAPSQNELERLYRGEPWFRDLVWKKTFSSLVGKAFNLAQHEIFQMDFFKLCKYKYENPDLCKGLYEVLEPKESFEWLKEILTFNNIDHGDFFGNVFDIMDKRLPKINTLMLKGSANAGKTLICESIARACIFYCNIQQFAKGKNFIFMDAVGKRCCMINEPRITDEHAEVLKNVLEGAATHVDVKFQTGQMLQRTPVVIATNHELSMFLQQTKAQNEAAYRSRMIKYELKTMPRLAECKYQLHPGLWYLAACHLKTINREFNGSEELGLETAMSV